jgi:hypothetical protein
MNQSPGVNPPTLISEYQIRDAIVKDGVYLMRDISKIKNAVNLVNIYLFKKYKNNVVLSIVEETTEYDLNLTLDPFKRTYDLYCIKYNINILVYNMVDETRWKLIKHIKDVFRWIGVHLEEAAVFAMTASTSPNIFYQSLDEEKNFDSPVVIKTGFFITSSLFMKKVEFEQDNYQFYHDYYTNNTKTKDKTMLDKFIGLFV